MRSLVRFSFYLISVNCDVCGIPVARPKNPHKRHNNNDVVASKDLKPTRAQAKGEFKPLGRIMCTKCLSKYKAEVYAAKVGPALKARNAVMRALHVG